MSLTKVGQHYFPYRQLILVLQIVALGLLYGRGNLLKFLFFPFGVASLLLSQTVSC